MNLLIEIIVYLALSLALWGNAIFGVWCLLRKRRRVLVASLLLSWYTLSFTLFVAFFGLYGHSRPPAFVEWLSGIYLVLGVALCLFLFRLVLAGSNEPTDTRRELP